MLTKTKRLLRGSGEDTVTTRTRGVVRLATNRLLDDESDKVLYNVIYLTTETSGKDLNETTLVEGSGGEQSNDGGMFGVNYQSNS